MPRKSTKVKPEKFETLEAADGANESKLIKQGPRTISDVLAGGQRKKIGQTVEEYTQYITGLSLAELQHHAYSKQLMPVHNRKILEERLLREFHRERIEGSVSTQPIEPFNTEAKKKVVLDILKAGR